MKKTLGKTFKLSRNFKWFLDLICEYFSRNDKYMSWLIHILVHNVKKSTKKAMIQYIL